LRIRPITSSRGRTKLVGFYEELEEEENYTSKQQEENKGGLRIKRS
jgi:hypothetical protein